MNLWFRLLCYALTAWWRPAIKHTADALDVGTLNFMVLPTDLDFSLHMNNGRYLTVMDIGRLDFLVRTGLWRAVRKNGWTPIASAIIVRYRRELRPFARFRLETRLVYWAEASVVMEQTFVLINGPHAGQVAARALFKGGIYSRSERKFVDVARMMREIGVAGISPPPTPDIEAFVKADGALKMTAAAHKP